MTNSKKEDLEDPSDTIIESLFLLSIEHEVEVESQRISPAHSLSNISKSNFEDEIEALVDLTKEIPIGYQGWYCDHMEEKEHESMTTFTNLPMESVDARVCAQLHQPTGCEVPNAALESSLHKPTTYEEPNTTTQKNTTISANKRISI